MKMLEDDSENQGLLLLDLECDGIRQSVKDLIYYAAKDGHALSLCAALNSIDNIELRNYIINQEFQEEDGQRFSPFVVAAMNGRHTVVKTLLLNYKPEIEKECVVKFDGHMVYGATALWCAAGSGHLNIVKLLIKHDADVNHKTQTQSSPLRAACFDGRLDIVKYLVLHGGDINLANAYNNTCLMISSYKGHTDIVEYLLANGAFPDEQALCGATALHYAAECGNLEICASLLDYGATLKFNEFGMTPVIAAAERTRELVVEHFYNRPNLLAKNQKIDALELMGASFANDKDNYSLSKAFHYLMMAMELRYEDPANVIRKPLAEPVPAYENWVESQTVQELQAIRYNNNSIHMESLTIRERILGRKCPDVAHPVVFRGAVCADNGRFDRCESLWLHALELRQEIKISVQRDLLRFAQLFSQMIHVGISMRLTNVLTVLATCVTELKRNNEKMLNPGPKDDVEVISEEYEHNIVSSLYLLTIITRLLKRPNQKMDITNLTTLYKLVYILNKMNPKMRDGQSLLHLSVNGVTPVDNFHTNDVCRFPCLDTVKLLLHCGARVIAYDCDRNTPLHTLTSTLQTARTSENNEVIETVEKITNLFIDAGVHLDSVNKNGLTAAQMCNSNVTESLVKRYETQSTTLKCLASRCIARHKLKYKGTVPVLLENFIQMHSADKL